jgi:DNA-binding transcriptional LysR family regulator
MDLRQLAVVVAVAEEGGFTAAAHRLRTVQSTVSTVVRALERDLGTPLFHRTTHRVALTPAGEAFVPAARAALEAVERARAVLSPVRGRVRLGLAAGLLLDLPRVLTALRHAHPGLVVEVRRLSRAEQRHAVAESAVDICVGSSVPGEPATTRLVSEELVLATAPGGSRSAPADLSGLSLVDFPPGWAIRDAVDRAFACRRVTLEADDLAAAAGLVRAGLAACVLPASAAARFPDLTARRFDRPPAWQVAATHSADPGPAVSAVLAQLR